MYLKTKIEVMKYMTYYGLSVDHVVVLNVYQPLKNNTVIRVLSVNVVIKTNDLHYPKSHILLKDLDSSEGSKN